MIDKGERPTQGACSVTCTISTIHRSLVPFACASHPGRVASSSSNFLWPEIIFGTCHDPSPDNVLQMLSWSPHEVMILKKENDQLWFNNNE